MASSVNERDLSLEHTHVGLREIQQEHLLIHECNIQNHHHKKSRLADYFLFEQYGKGYSVNKNGAF